MKQRGFANNQGKATPLDYVQR